MQRITRLESMCMYAVVMTYMYDKDLDFYNDDDLKDAIVDITYNDGHFSDEELNETLDLVREVRAIVNV